VGDEKNGKWRRGNVKEKGNMGMVGWRMWSWKGKGRYGKGMGDEMLRKCFYAMKKLIRMGVDLAMKSLLSPWKMYFDVRSSLLKKLLERTTNGMRFVEITFEAVIAFL
jgi:hypothetical protein